MSNLRPPTHVLSRSPPPLLSQQIVTAISLTHAGRGDRSAAGAQLRRGGHSQVCAVLTASVLLHCRTLLVESGAVFSPHQLVLPLHV
jgi:hypothetical protein